MDYIQEKFSKLGVDNAPGQEGRHKEEGLLLFGEPLKGDVVDFSHGDVNAFKPIPGCLDVFVEGFEEGAAQAYTEYSGRKILREELAEKIGNFMNVTLDPSNGLIITPGTQGALFLAMGSLITTGDKVAIVEPDYFANRKLVNFFDGEIVPVKMDYFKESGGAGLDVDALEAAFKSGAKVFVFSNPNNPTGAVYSKQEINKIATLAKAYNVSLIVDELYSRQIYNGEYTHLCACAQVPEQTITIIGPSKTESLSGFRLGVAFGTPNIVERMEKLQAIVSLRAGGYNQKVLQTWFSEPEDWMKKRVLAHREIRDEMIAVLRSCPGIDVRTTDGGSYIFPKLPELIVGLDDFIKILRVHANVIVTPGTEFGPSFTDSFRMNFSQEKSAAMGATMRIVEMVERYRK
ncbi:MAG: aminotransferase class I/II-fold pyridoxal phosphate-dependent enzyme [Clostridia bacterium]|nr:aminotransferase class I/II-fold pyridoxal phosphate-dependent enzyme [Clostridia bacterium]